MHSNSVAAYDVLGAAGRAGRRSTSTFSRLEISAMQPFRLQPILKRALWGGRGLGDALGKSLGPESDYSESWEVADLPGNISQVKDGDFAGLSLRNLVQDFREPLLGRHASSECYPLLIKYLDAHRVLSVQVHPSEQMAARRPEVTTGKAEAWVVLEAAPEAMIYAGLQPGVDEQVLRKAVATGEMAHVLHGYAVRKGDCVFLRPGTVHALGAGLLVAEVQQPNDVTYRLYDWGRVGPDGKPRELHLEQSIEATNFDFGPVAPVTPLLLDGGLREGLVRSPYFHVDRAVGPTLLKLEPADRSSVLMCIEGVASAASAGATWNLRRGDTLVLPADREAIEIDIPERSAVLEAYLP